MQTFLIIILVGALAATAVTLIYGLISMFRSEKERTEKNNALMRMRVLFQAFALLVFALLLWTQK